MGTADAIISTPQVGLAPDGAPIGAFPVLHGRRGYAEGSSGLSNTAECVDHLRHVRHGVRHGDGLYDYRITGQAAFCDFATGAHYPEIVHGSMDELDRIIAAFEASGRRRTELAAALRVSGPSIGRLLRRERRLTAIERQAAFSFLALEGAPSPMLRAVPIIGMISAGQWTDAVQQPVGETFTRSGGPRSFALRIEGDSMDQIAPSGASVVIDPDERDLSEGRSYAIIREDGTATFKRYRAEPARLEPVSTNPIHRPIRIGSEPFTVVGRAIEVTQDL